jgi:N6-adenosine-specific RNA methylase IME4
MLTTRTRGVREIIVVPAREHSRKPVQFYERVEAFCSGPRLELFGRESRVGWTVYGDEATKFDAPVALLCFPSAHAEATP